MQFAGIRTDMQLNPIGEPVNELIRLGDDTLPSPHALAVTGIMPQQTLQDGYHEAEFARKLYDEVFTPDTIAVGFNNIRFDDEFLRFFFWRNFYDPYEWSWKDGRSRWDLLDVVRMTRALRPDGITWPHTEDGTPTNRLELLTQQNGITHSNAHDALSDVEALIAVTKLIRDTQPQLYEYLLNIRGKQEVKALVNLDEKKPFVYTSGRYESVHEKTTVAFPLTSGRNGNVVVYDLRYDPTPFLECSAKELAAKLFASWETRRADDFVALPVKELQYNHAPAVAPLGVLAQQDGWSRIHLDEATVTKHIKILMSAPHFAENLRTAYEGRAAFAATSEPESQLYDAFLGDKDRLRVETVRNATPNELADFQPQFDDERLSPLLLHYKARNFPQTLSESEATEWESWKNGRIRAQLPAFMKSLQQVAKDDANSFLVQELQLWAESVIPVDGE